MVGRGGNRTSEVNIAGQSKDSELVAERRPVPRCLICKGNKPTGRGSEEGGLGGGGEGPGTDSPPPSFHGGPRLSGKKNTGWSGINPPGKCYYKQYAVVAEDEGRAICAGWPLRRTVYQLEMLFHALILHKLHPQTPTTTLQHSHTHAHTHTTYSVQKLSDLWLPVN